MTFVLADYYITTLSQDTYTPYVNCEASLAWMALLEELKNLHQSEGIIGQELHDFYIQKFQELKPAILEAHKNSGMTGHLKNPTEIEEYAAGLTEEDWDEACNATFVAATIPPEHIHNESTKRWGELLDELWDFLVNPAKQGTMTEAMADDYRQQFQALKPAILDAEKKTLYGDQAEELTEDAMEDALDRINSAIKKPAERARTSN